MGSDEVSGQKVMMLPGGKFPGRKGVSFPVERRKLSSGRSFLVEGVKFPGRREQAFHYRLAGVKFSF